MGVRYRTLPPWLQITPEVQNRWSLVCADINRNRQRPQLVFDYQQWKTVCRDVQNYQWNMGTCALWHLVKIELFEETSKEWSSLIPVQLLVQI